MRTLALLLMLTLAGCASTGAPKVAPLQKVDLAPIDPRLSRTPAGLVEIPPSVTNEDGKLGMYLDVLQPIVRENSRRLKSCVGHFVAYRDAVQARDATQGVGLK